MIHVRGGSFWGDIEQAVVWNNAGLLAISDSQFNGWSKDKSCIEINAGRAMIRGNYFQDVIGTALAIGPNSDRVLATGNELIGNKIKNEGKDTLIETNHA